MLRSPARRLLPLLLLLPAAAPAKEAKKAAPPPKAALARVRAAEGITEYSLPNGLKVLLFPDPSKQTITVNVTYLVGARHEGYGETGMAHLLEHLVFKGTDKHPNIPQELTAHGARPNGTTSFDRTNYFETFQATDENLRWALDLEADRMVNSHIWKKDLDTEMTVVRNEFEMGENNPQGVLIKRMLAAAFQEHNYKHLPIGSRSDIENVPIDRLKAFYQRFYQPDNAVLTITGRFDEQKTLALVEKLFAPIPRPKRELIPTYTAEPAQDGERQVTLRRTGDVQLVMGAWHVPSALHPDAPALQLLAFVLGNTPAGRLHKALVESQKASGAFGFTWGLREPGLILFGAEVRQEKPLADARAELLKVVEGLAAAPVTAEEVERARVSALKNIDLTLNQSEVLGLQLSEWIAKGDWRLFFLNRDLLKKVTAEQVQAAALRYLKPTNRTLGEFLPTTGPEKVEVAAAPSAAALLEGWTGQAAVVAGEAFDPAPANVDARTQRSQLPGGLKLALLPKKTRGGTVIATLTLRLGDAQSLKGQEAVADLMADLLSRGTAKHTRQEFADALDKLKARLTIGGSAERLSASIQTVRESLPATLDLLAEALRQPVFPADQLEQLRQENLAAIEQQRTEPGDMAQNKYRRHFAPYERGDVRHVSTVDESLADYKAATLEQVKAFHAGFVGAAHGELAVVGDFDAKEIAAKAAVLLDGWRAPKPYERVPRPFVAAPPVAEKLEAPDKANAVLLAGQSLELRDDDPDYPALLLGNYVLGGGFLNSRLAVRIRQKEGLSYGVFSMLVASPLDKAGAFMVQAIHAPQNTQKLEAAVREELKRAIEEGFTEQEVSEAKAGWLQSRNVSRTSDQALAGTLANGLFLGRTLAWDAALEQKVGALDRAALQDALKRRLDPSKLTWVRAGDFAKGEKAAAPAAAPASAK